MFISLGHILIRLRRWNNEIIIKNTNYQLRRWQVEICVWADKAKARRTKRAAYFKALCVEQHLSYLPQAPNEANFQELQVQSDNCRRKQNIRERNKLQQQQHYTRQ